MSEKNRRQLYGYDIDDAYKIVEKLNWISHRLREGGYTLVITSVDLTKAGDFGPVNGFVLAINRRILPGGE